MCSEYYTRRAMLVKNATLMRYFLFHYTRSPFPPPRRRHSPLWSSRPPPQRLGAERISDTAKLESSLFGPAVHTHLLYCAHASFLRCSTTAFYPLTFSFPIMLRYHVLLSTYKHDDHLQNET